MKSMAAVLVEFNQPLELADLEFPPLKPGQVLVEIAFSGMCHTQILEWHGHRGPDPYLPHCLGHEGGGIVREVGAQVTKVKIGDNVILSWMKGLGADIPGTVYRWQGKSVNAGAITTFSRYSIISENRLTLLSEGSSVKDAALLGCTTATGVGALFNTAGAKSGQSVVVFGAGGIGLSALAAAASRHCSPLYAVDINAEKLKSAGLLGARPILVTDGRDPVQEILRDHPAGVDIAVEATGQPGPMQQALRVIRARGGTAVIIGNAKEGTRVEFDPKEFNLGKRLFGTWGGDNNPDRDFPAYLGLIKKGELNLAPLASRTYRLSEINQALKDLENGLIVRPLVDMSLE